MKFGIRLRPAFVLGVVCMFSLASSARADFGGALLFNGTNSYVVATVINLIASNSMSLEVWIKPSGLTNTGYMEIIRQQGYGNPDWLLSFQLHGSKLSFGVDAGSSYQELDAPINPNDFDDGNWHHVAATYDGTTKNLYRDGVLIGTTNQSGNVTLVAEHTGMGASLDTYLPPSEFFNGAMDEVRVWNIARQPADINSQMNAPLTGTEPGLAAYWNFDEGTGATAGDATGHGYTGTLVGSPTWITSTVGPSSGHPSVVTGFASHITATNAVVTGGVNPNGIDATAYLEYGTTTDYGNQTVAAGIGSGTQSVGLTNLLAGLTPATTYHYRYVGSNVNGTVYGSDRTVKTGITPGNYAVSFNGTNGYVSAPPVIPGGSNSLTLEAWIKPATLTNTSDSVIISQKGYSSPNWQVGFQNFGTVLAFGLFTRSGYQELHVPINPGDFLDGNWHHLAATYDGTSKLLFKDGVQIGSATNQTGPVVANGERNIIGADVNFRSPPGKFFNGLMDEVQIWNIARGSAAINGTMFAELYGNEPGLVAYYRFNDGTGTTATDGTGNGRNGTLVNGVNWVSSNVPTTPPPVLPKATTGGAGNLTLTGADITGSVNPNGIATTVYFEYGTTTGYGSQTTSVDAGSGTASAGFTSTLSGLVSGTGYHYRIVAVSANGTVHGVDRVFYTTVPPGNRALNLNGTTDYAVAAAIDLGGASSLTLEAWIKPNALTNTGYMEIVRQQGYGNPDWLLSFQKHATQLSFGLKAGGFYSELHVPINPDDYTDGNWHHIAATYDGANKIIYKDGVQIGVATDQAGPVGFTGEYMGIGASLDSYLPPAEFFNGAMDEVRIWDVALSAPDITGSMYAHLAGTETGLAAYWKFDEGDGTEASDATGHGHDAVLKGSLQWIDSTVPAGPQAGAPLVFTGSATGVGTNHAVLTGSINPNGSGATAWFQIGTSTNYSDQTAPVDVGSGNVSVGLSNSISGLVTAATYHYRLAGSNGNGIVHGLDRVFTTASPAGNHAVLLNGANNYITAPAVNLGGASSLTLEAWIKPNALTNTGYSEIIRQQGYGNPDWLLSFQVSGTLLTFGLNAGGSYQELRVPINAADYTDGNWHHIAAVYDGSHKYLFKDGVQIGTASQSGPVTFNGTRNGIGANLDAGLAPAEFFNGAIDEVRVWSIARSSAQINSAMFTQLTGGQPGLVEYYQFDDSAGATAVDASGNGRTATLANSTAWIPSTLPSGPVIGSPVAATGPAVQVTTNSAALTGSVNANGTDTSVYFEYGTNTVYTSQTTPVDVGSGNSSVGLTNALTGLPAGTMYHYRLVATAGGTNVYGADQTFSTIAVVTGNGALLFNGTNAYVTAPAINLTGSNALTLEAWIKPNTITNTGYMEIIRQQGFGNPDWLLSFQDHGTLLSFGLDTTDAYYELQVPINAAEYADGNWHHIAATYDGTNKYMFKDGVLIGSATNQSGALLFHGTRNGIGASLDAALPPSEFFNGTIDEVRIWSVARSAASINASLYSGLDGTEAGLAEYYRFDDGQGTTAADSSPNAQVATLTNNPIWVVSTVPGAPAGGGTSTRTTYSLAARNIIITGKPGKLSAPTALANGHMQMRFVGNPGKTYRVQTSTNLSSWTDLGSVTADATGQVQYEDTTSGGVARRFYRTVSP